MNLDTQLALIIAGYLAEHADEGWIKAQTIAEHYGLSVFYISKVMERMKKANLLLSRRGLGGGSQLARPAKEVSVLNIVESIEGRIEYTANLPKKMPVGKLFSPYLEEAFKQASEKEASVLNKASLKQMVG